MSSEAVHPAVLALTVLAHALAPIAERLGAAGLLDERGIYRVPPGMSEEQAGRRFADAFSGEAQR